MRAGIFTTIPCSGVRRMATTTGVAKKTWLESLKASIAENNEPMASMALSTLSLDGSPACRIVICRKVDQEGSDPSHGRIITTTQTDSEKWKELKADQRFELCWYFGKTREQYRIRGSHTDLLTPPDPQATKIWEEMTEQQKEMFTKKATDGDGPYGKYGLLSLKPSSVQLLNLINGEVTTWDIK